MNAYIEYKNQWLGRIVTEAVIEKVTAKRIVVAGMGTYSRLTGKPTQYRHDDARVLAWNDNGIDCWTVAGEEFQKRPTDDSAFSAWVEKQWFPTTEG